MKNAIFDRLAYIIKVAKKMNFLKKEKKVVNFIIFSTRDILYTGAIYTEIIFVNSGNDENFLS